MQDKQLVAIEAAKHVQADMLIGLGTGSTANFFIDELARRQQEEGLQVTAVASSTVSSYRAQSAGLKVAALEHISRLDLYVDGADEITPDLTVLKGRGSDLVKEKLLAKAAKAFVVVADKTKYVTRIGEKYPIPIEVMPFAWQLVQKSLHDIGAKGTLRPNAAGDGFWITSHGSYVFDMTFDVSMTPSVINETLNNTPGVVEHGIFLNLANQVLIADQGKIETLTTP